MNLPFSAIGKGLETETYSLFSCDNLDTGLLFGRGFMSGRDADTVGKKVKPNNKVCFMKSHSVGIY